MKSVNNILRSALQEIVDAHGLIIKDLSISYVDASSMGNPHVSVDSINVRDCRIISPVSE